MSVPDNAWTPFIEPNTVQHWALLLELVGFFLVIIELRSPRTAKAINGYITENAAFRDPYKIVGVEKDGHQTAGKVVTVLLGFTLAVFCTFLLFLWRDDWFKYTVIIIIALAILLYEYVITLMRYVFNEFIVVARTTLKEKGKKDDTWYLRLFEWLAGQLIGNLLWIGVIRSAIIFTINLVFTIFQTAGKKNGIGGFGLLLSGLGLFMEGYQVYWITGSFVAEVAYWKLVGGTILGLILLFFVFWHVGRRAT